MEVLVSSQVKVSMDQFASPEGISLDNLCSGAGTGNTSGVGKKIDIVLLIRDYQDGSEHRFKTPLLTIETDGNDPIGVSAQAVIDTLEHAPKTLHTCQPLYPYIQKLNFNSPLFSQIQWCDGYPLQFRTILKPR